MHIDHAFPSDAGKYGITLTNSLGTDSAEAKATVHKVFSPPRFMQTFTDLQQVSVIINKHYHTINNIYCLQFF